MSYTFLPWLREGLAADISTVVGAAGIQLVVNQTPLPPLPLRLLGPGDIQAINPEQIIRTDPSAGARAVEPNYFPFVEFDEPSLPWLFTPGSSSDHDHHLPPWISLVVIRKQPGVTAQPDPVTKTTTLVIEPPAVPARELPNLTEASAWAHIQISGSTADNKLKQLLRTQPSRTLSRLVCPRRLHPQASYLACVVPSFAAGRAAALGENLEGDPAALAWTQDAKRVRLPVYYLWEFDTGELGDFEQLAARLKPALETFPGIGRRVLHLGQPGFQVPGGYANTADFSAALRPVDQEPPQDDLPTPEPSWFTARMARLLSDFDQHAVKPPLYGAAQTSATELPAGGWLRTLNTTPAYRTAAGLGARFVRDQQDSLVEAAWKQADQLQAANRFLAHAQLATAINETISRRIDQLGRRNRLAMLQVLAPTRLPRGDASRNAVNGTVPPATLSPAYRKLTRPRLVITRRVDPGAGGSDGVQRQLLVAFAGSPMGVVQPVEALRARVAAQLVAPDDMALMQRPDPTAQIVRPPVYPAPLSLELQRLSPEHLLPGAQHIPEDTVVIFEPNRAFLAAFLAGANHEMSRELLWREFPTDLSATYFRVFWDRRGHTSAAMTVDELVDIAPIAEWASPAPLGAGVVGAEGAELVMVVRGELLRRYPRAVVYAIRADGAPGARVLADESIPDNQAWPLFSGFLEPDVTFFGFALSAAEARGDADGKGWFFVFQQQPTEPRLGLDEFNESQLIDPPAGPDGKPTIQSRDLGWGHLRKTKAELDDLTHAPIADARLSGWTFADRPGVSWAAGSADQAVLALRRPARVALHGARLLKGP